jgi:allophanate hydrolase
MSEQRISLAIADLRPAFVGGEVSPSDIIGQVFDRIGTPPDRSTWIHLRDRAEVIDQARALEDNGPDNLPLYGIPFAVKDNIDIAGIPTTAGCPAFSHVPEVTATAVQKLMDAGALLIGKTNMDQFATGLVGARSPYGAGRNTFDPAYVSGGSSSGSAIAVADGLVSFSLGTDTAGSGRVPAAFNNIVGLKPTRGAISAHGVVPACRTLDCISIFAFTADDARAVFDVAVGFDARDPFSRPLPDARPVFDGKQCRFGIPRDDDLEFFGDDEARRLFEEQVARVSDEYGAPRQIDFRPFVEAARLLYEGPWLAERYAAVGAFIDDNSDEVDPTVRAVIAKGKEPSAVDMFNALYRLNELRQQTLPVWEEIDVLMTPTAGTIYTIEDVMADPIRLNANLGYYTNFVNLMDLSAFAVPAGITARGLPFGVTLVGQAGHDRALAALGDRLQRAAVTKAGATGLPLPKPAPSSRDLGERINVVVCGAHMSGLPLNHQLTSRGGRLLDATRTAPHYRLFALTEFDPPRPGMVHDETGRAIEVELWAVPTGQFGSFVDGIPAPLGIGTVTLDDGSEAKGFVCESYALENAEEVTHLGSWRRYISRKNLR